MKKFSISELWFAKKAREFCLKNKNSSLAYEDFKNWILTEDFMLSPDDYQEIIKFSSIIFDEFYED